jgi:hypothetical protein
MSFPILGAVLETYTRFIKVGDCEAMLGPRYVVAIVRAFTTGEDAVMTWVRMQDDTRLVDIVPLMDGRDFCVFERNYLFQTREAAFLEAEAFTTAVSRLIPKQHDTPKRNSAESVMLRD